MLESGKDIKFAFFGSSDFSVVILNELLEKGYKPSLVVTTPDKPRGRKMRLLPTPVKEWALSKDIEVLSPEKLDRNFEGVLAGYGFDLFVVASYGLIIPGSTLEIPPYGALNVHPSLLPHLRGPSPVESAILGDDRVTGASIMLLDEKMDHGPILAQETFEPEEWPPKASELERDLAHLGGRLLAEVIPEWLAGNIDAQEQDHGSATYTKKISKDDGEIDLGGNAYENLLKIRAYDVWPRAYFFLEHPSKTDGKMRVVVTEAHIEKGVLVLDKVIPEGKKEMRWADFERNL